MAQLLVNDLGLLVAAWSPDTNNYRAAVEAMDQRNAVGRAFNGMTVLAGYEIPLRRIGAGLFPANANFQQSPFSDTSAADNRFAFEGARAVYTDAGFDDLLSGIDPALAAEVARRIRARRRRARAARRAALRPLPGAAARQPRTRCGRGRGARPDRSRPRAAPGGQPARRARGRPRALSPDLARLTTASQAQAKASIPAPTDAKRRGPHTTRTQRGITMLTRCLLASTALALAGAAQAHDILPVVDVVTEAANDLRGVTFAADGKIYVSGHKGDVETETTTVIGRFNADGTPDAAFGEDGFVEVDLAPGRVEQSLAVAELSGGDVVAVVNAVDEDGGQSVYLLRFDSSGARKAGADWGGDGGVVEVVFGWANADNDSFPGVEAPPEDTAWDLLVDATSGEEKLVVAGFGAAADDTGRTDNDRYVARLLAADGSPDPAFNGGAPSPTTRRRPSTTAGGAPASKPTARS